ncbi:MAG: type IX secretion system membrane protein PorP/SprF [Bacteroidetes bacterium]|nr:type IX secretion system membrane protein PorP/SprF [Bacteroidota bacterium]
MKQKYISSFLCALLAVQGVNLMAQQLPQYSQYMLNDFVMNPAIAGRSDYWEAKSNNRYQWVGIPDAPRTYMLSLQGPFKNYKMGMGGNIYTDIVGPTRRTGIDLVYAYHIKLNAKYKLSLGLNAGIVQYAVDGSKITTHDPGDPVLSANYQSTIVPDVGAGIYFYSKKLSIGIGFPQLYQAKLKFFVDQTTNQSRLAPHFYGLATYKINLGENFVLQPGLLVKYVAPVPLQVDIGLQCIYKNTVWIGANFRTNDAVSVLFGYMYKNWLLFGYSYDYSITPIRKYNSGTHEVMIGLRFKKAPRQSTPASDMQLENK